MVMGNGFYPYYLLPKIVGEETRSLFHLPTIYFLTISTDPLLVEFREA